LSGSDKVKTESLHPAKAGKKRSPERAADRGSSACHPKIILGQAAEIEIPKSQGGKFREKQNEDQEDFGRRCFRLARLLLRRKSERNAPPMRDSSEQSMRHGGLRKRSSRGGKTSGARGPRSGGWQSEWAGPGDFFKIAALKTSRERKGLRKKGGE